MYTPEAFRVEDRAEITAMIRACRLATLVTTSMSGLLATPLPMLYFEDEGQYGTLYGHISRANTQWKESAVEEGMAIFQGENTYITPSWYATKAETGRVVPTWNYLAVHCYGPVEFFHESDRLLEVVTGLTNLYEAGRAKAWSVEDAPKEYVEALLKAIVGVRIPISRMEAKKKMSQNQPVQNRVGVKAGLAESQSETERRIAKMIPD